MSLAASRTSMMAPSYNRWPLLRQASMVDPDFLSGLREHEQGLIPRSISAGYPVRNPVRTFGMGYPTPFFGNRLNNFDLDAEKLLLEKRLEACNTKMENFLMQTQSRG